MKSIVTCSLVGCVLSLVWLAGCGGGGGVTPGPNTQSITIPVQDDAQVTATLLLPWDSVGITLVSISLGDDTVNNAYRGLMRFPLSAIPAGANVVGAQLHVQFLDRLGKPGDTLGGEIGGLGDIEFHRLVGTPLALSDFSAPSVAHDPASDLTADKPNQAVTVGCLALLQSALAGADTHLKVRVQYEALSDNDGVLDQLRMGTRNTGNGAILEVTIQP